MNLGATCTKMSQNGLNPRRNFVEHGLSPRSRSYQCGSSRIHKSRPKGLNQVKLSPNPKTTRRFRTKLNLRSNMGLESNVPERRKPKPSQSQAGRPRRGRPASNCHRWGCATSTDLRRRSRVFTQKGGSSRPPLGLCNLYRPQEEI